MTETNDEIMVHLLQVSGAVDDMHQDMRELKLPLGALENRYVGMSNRWYRIERIGRRLDLVDV